MAERDRASRAEDRLNVSTEADRGRRLRPRDAAAVRAALLAGVAAGGAIARLAVDRVDDPVTTARCDEVNRARPGYPQHALHRVAAGVDHRRELHLPRTACVLRPRGDHPRPLPRSPDPHAHRRAVPRDRDRGRRPSDHQGFRRGNDRAGDERRGSGRRHEPSVAAHRRLRCPGGRRGGDGEDDGRGGQLAGESHGGICVSVDSGADCRFPKVPSSIQESPRLRRRGPLAGEYPLA